MECRVGTDRLTRPLTLRSSTHNVLTGLYETHLNKSGAVDRGRLVWPGSRLFFSLLYVVPMASRSALVLRLLIWEKVCLFSADV